MRTVNKTLCRVRNVAALLLLALFIAGCTSYYKVSDVATGKVYYTKELAEKKGGAVAFKDAKTNATITLQSSEVQKIDEKQFDVGVYSEK
jgi:hypothetical protein